jgi:hypothetical protein
MVQIKRILLICCIIIISTSFSFRRIDYRDAMFKNVCKDLKHEALLYFIFVDNKTTAPWTEFDIQSTIDSVNIAIRWLQQQAFINNIPLHIKTDYYIGPEYSTINKSLPQGTVYNTLTKPNLRTGLNEINSWADAIAKKAGASLNLSEKDGIPEIKNPRNKERLIAYLRDTYKVESVALLFMVNNYFKTDISVQVNTFNTSDVEFAVVSYKYPSEIAHSFLHLYGAADMYNSPFRKNDKKIKQLQEMYPNEIMLDPYAKNISKLEIGDYTKFLIGWKEQFDPKLEPLFIDKALNF